MWHIFVENVTFLSYDCIMSFVTSICCMCFLYCTIYLFLANIKKYDLIHVYCLSTVYPGGVVYSTFTYYCFKTTISCTSLLAVTQCRPICEVSRAIYVYYIYH